MDEALVPKERARIITGVFYFISGLITATWASRIPDIQYNLALTDAQLGLVLFFLPIGPFLAMPVSAWLVAKFGSANLIPLSALLFAVLLCFLGFSSTRLQLSAALLLYGVSRNFFNITLNTHSIEVQQLYEKPIIVTFHGVWSAACLVAAGLGTVMIRGKVPVLLHFILVTAVAAFVCFCFRKYKLYNQPDSSARKPLFVKPDKYLFLLGLIAFCTMLTESITFDWSINYFDKVVHAGRNNSTFGYTSFIIAMCIGRFTGDKMVAIIGTKRMLMLNGSMIATGFSIIIWAPALLPSTLGFLLVGLGNATTIPVVYSLAGKSKSMPTAYALTSVTLIGFMGFLLGPLVAGSVSQAFGMHWIFVVTLLLGLFIPAIAAVLNRVKE